MYRFTLNRHCGSNPQSPADIGNWLRWACLTGCGSASSAEWRK